MSIVITRTVFCDISAPGCVGWCAEQTDATADMVRAEARRCGWSRRKGKDICPNCAEPTAVPAGGDGTDGGAK